MCSARRLSWFLAVVLVLSVVALVGCGRKEPSEKTAEGMMERTLEKATGEKTDVDIEGGDVTIRSGDSTVKMTETSEWPADMFSDVPRFTYGVVERVSSGQEGGMTKFNVYLRDVQDDAMDKYGADLKAAGWRADMSVMSETGGMLNAQKGDIAVQLVCNKEDRTGVFIAYSVPE